MEPQRHGEQRHGEGSKRHHRQHNWDHHRKHRDEGEPSRKPTPRHKDTALADRVESETQPVLSGDKSYVRRWLAETNEEHPESPSIQQILTRKNGICRESIASKMQRQHAHLENQEFPPEKGFARLRAKRKHNSSSDSSLLKVPSWPRSKEEKRKVANDHRNEPSKRCRRESHPAAPSSAFDMSIRPKETFEKRARHKTREERYEPKVRVHKEDKVNDTKRTTSKRLKKSSRSKPKKDGGELMRNFTSNTLGHERLTMRPSYGLGLFRNGRTSEPKNTNGVPDLAFSGMESLGHAERPRQSVEIERMISTSREKEIRKTSKPVQDISAFFNQFRPPLHEAAPNRGRAHSVATSYMMARPHKPAEFPGFQQKRVHSDRISLSSQYCAGINPPGSASKVSGREVSYISWSESHFSPRLPDRADYADRFIRHHTSPTPDSVRRSLESTGIYQGTGIDLNNDFTRPISQNTREREEQGRQEGPRREYQNPGEPPSDRKANTSRLSPRSTTDLNQQSRSSTPREGSQTPVFTGPSDQIDQRAREEEITRVQSRTSHQTTSLKPKYGPQRIAAEHLNQELSCIEKPPTSTSLVCQSSRPFLDPVIPEPLSVSRKELARLAKVQRPATTVPLVLPTRSVSNPAERKPKPEAEKFDTQPPEEPENEFEKIPAAKGPTPQSAQPPVARDKPAHDVNPKHMEPLQRSYVLIQRGVGESFHNNTTFTPSLNEPQFSSHNSRPLQVSPAPQVDKSTMLSLPLRGGMVRQIGPSTSSYCNVQPLFIRQIQANAQPRQDHDPGGLQIFQPDIRYQQIHETGEVQQLQPRIQYQPSYHLGRIQRLQSDILCRRRHSPGELQHNGFEYSRPQSFGGVPAMESQPTASLDYESVVYLQNGLPGHQICEYEREGMTGDDELLYPNNSGDWQNENQYNDYLQSIDAGCQFGNKWYGYDQQQEYGQLPGPDKSNGLLFGENV